MFTANWADLLFCKNIVSAPGLNRVSLCQTVFFLVGFVLRLPAQTSVFSPDVKVCFKTNTGKAWSYATPLQAHMHFVWKMNSDISFFKVFSHIFIPFYSLFLCCLLSQTMSCSEKLLRDEWNMKPEDTSTVTNFPLQQNVKACFTHVALS